LINARTLDELLRVAKEKPEENLLRIQEWAPQMLNKVKLTTPQCPACEAPMDQLSVSDGSVWVCSERPKCRGRRCVRKYQKPEPAKAPKAEVEGDAVPA
jgi:ssDNA-binding Zn-finger/Zn-ribbon topoisomerase 1